MVYISSRGPKRKKSGGPPKQRQYTSALMGMLMAYDRLGTVLRGDALNAAQELFVFRSKDENGKMIMRSFPREARNLLEWLEAPVVPHSEPSKPPWED